MIWCVWVYDKVCGMVYMVCGCTIRGVIWCVWCVWVYDKVCDMVCMGICYEVWDGVIWCVWVHDMVYRMGDRVNKGVR